MVEFYYICVPKTLVVSFTGLISSPNLWTFRKAKQNWSQCWLSVS